MKHWLLVLLIFSPVHVPDFLEDCLTLTYESFRDEGVCAHNKEPSKKSVLNECLCTLLLAG